MIFFLFTSLTIWILAPFCSAFHVTYKRDFPSIPITLTGFNGRASVYDLEMDLQNPLTVVFGEECQEAGFCTTREVKPFHPTMKTYEYDLFDTSLKRVAQYKGRMHRENVEIGSFSKNLSIGVVLSIQITNFPAELNADGRLGLGFLNGRVAIINHLFEHAGDATVRRNIVMKQSKYSPLWTTKENEHYYPEQEGQVFLSTGDEVDGCDQFIWYDTFVSNGQPTWNFNGTITVGNKTFANTLSLSPSTFTQSTQLKSIIPLDIVERPQFPDITIEIDGTEYVMTYEDYVTRPMHDAEHVHRTVFSDSRTGKHTLLGMDMLHKYCVALSKLPDGTHQIGLAVNNDSPLRSYNMYILVALLLYSLLLHDVGSLIFNKSA